MIDTHCHLADKQFTEDIRDVLDRARAVGVSPMITIADSLPEAERCIALVMEYQDLHCAIGVHPHNAKDWTEHSEAELRALVARSPKVVAIGEIGLDFHYDFSERETQRSVFRTQLTIAQDLNLPAVIHCREAVAEIRSILLEMKPRKAVIHCCTERWEDVQPLVDAGYHLSFTGIATYPKSDEIRTTIRQCPINQLMIETDAPYLAPVPHRGKRNEPAYVAEILKLIAELKGLSAEETDYVATENARKFFGLP